MTKPTLTFACELGRDRLGAFFSEGAVISMLQVLEARVALALADFSPPRAEAVKQLNNAGVPVVAIPLLPEEDGYYFTAERPDLARARYGEWKEWAEHEGLVFAGVGLDIEPDIRIYKQIAGEPWRLPLTLLHRIASGEAPARAASGYRALVEQIRADGWAVENYQFPLVADERRAGSTALQRLVGVVEVRSDREVWMLYSSFLRRLGPGFIWDYGPEAAAIAVGSTGGGPDIAGQPQVPALSWEELARDLRLAARFTDHVYVHSLEGCVEHGYLDSLTTFDWTPATRPDRAGLAATLRRVLQGTMWISAHAPQIAIGCLVATVGLRLGRRRPG